MDFILAGHKHALEVLAPVEGGCGRTRHIVSGAAAKSNGKRGDNNYVSEFESYEGKTGFFYGFVDGRNFTLTAYTVNTDGTHQQKFSCTYTKQNTVGL